MANKRDLSSNQDALSPGAVRDEGQLSSMSETDTAAHPQAARSVRFPIVGLGASAGGLTAFEAFFSGIPSNSEPGMAFVLVQHLAPDHKSILTEIIRRYTRMRVFEVEDGMTVQPNCTYIIPPNCDMALVNGKLQLIEPSAPRGQRLPIDFFFRSLAQDRRERAICIVLSGTGSDGSMGVRAVKGEGGMVMVQSPGSAEYDGMPRSAIATGLVDYELPPEKMGNQLMAFAAHAFGNSGSPAAMPEDEAENAIRKIFVLLRTQTGRDFSQYKPSTIFRRIQRRMAVHQIGDPADYVKYLENTPGEVHALFGDLLIGVTSFFRDREAFQALEEQVIPKLFADKPAGAAVRVWSPGCSTGEEAYSIAILLAEHQESIRKTFRIQVFATDIDSRAIAAARIGLYPASISTDISPERLARFFTAEPDGSAYRIHKSIRDLLVFSEQDVIKDPPFSRLDLISCRNLLIYMSGSLQKILIPLFHYVTNPGGFLFLGTSETVNEFGDLFATLDRKWKLYQRKGASREYRRAGSFLPLAASQTAVPQRPENKAGRARIPLRELTERTLLDHVAPACALVNDQGDILYLHGRTGRYLEPAQGEAGVNNILKMAREGLRQRLTIALHKAVGKRELVCETGLRVKTNGEFATVNLTVRSVPADKAAPFESPLMLVIFDEAVPEAKPPAKEDAQNRGLRREEDAAENGMSLKEQLRAKEEYLRAANEELETSNEELKSANEEMQSINEELQSTNEELETAKEELQSVNEELTTVNAELQAKVAELSRLNNDMNNLLAGTDIGTVFVNHQLHIVRFTPAATRIINLIQSDVGRPVGHIVSNLVNYDSLVADTRTVLDTLIPKGVDVLTKDGKWYRMRIQPYRTLDNVIEGAVVTFFDITEAKRTEALLSETQAILETALDHSKVGIAVADAPGATLRFVNDAGLLITGADQQSMAGMSVDQYLTNWPFRDVQGETLDREEVPLVRALLYGETCSRKLSVREADGGVRIISATASPIRNDHGDILAGVMVFMDATVRNQEDGRAPEGAIVAPGKQGV